MKKFLIFTLFSSVFSVANADISNPENPLFLGQKHDIVSRSTAEFFDSKANLNQSIAWTVTDKFAIGADISYRNDFDNSEDGFSGPRFDLKYRLSESDSFIYDFLGDIRFSGSSKVSEFDNTRYGFGLRGGISQSFYTLAATLKSSWIFDGDTNANRDEGYAWFDFIPEIQVQFIEDWSSNLSFDFRKATLSDEDDVIGKFSLAKMYGRTQYVGYIGYSFKKDKDLIAGFRLNLVF